MCAGFFLLLLFLSVSVSLCSFHSSFVRSFGVCSVIVHPFRSVLLCERVRFGLVSFGLVWFGWCALTQEGDRLLHTSTFSLVWHSFCSLFHIAPMRIRIRAYCVCMQRAAGPRQYSTYWPFSRFVDFVNTASLTHVSHALYEQFSSILRFSRFRCVPFRFVCNCLN